MYYYLVYSSKASSVFLPHDLEQILKHSRLGNARKDITGMLLYHAGKFVQVLEGEKEIVNQLYNTISGDERHSHVLKIIEGYIKERQFPDWSMAYREINGDEYDTVTGELALSKQSVLDNTTPALFSPLAAILKRFAAAKSLPISS